MKNLLLLAATALLGFTSCHKQVEEDPTGQNPSEMRYYIGVSTSADDASTRLNIDGYTVKWTAEDRLIAIPVVKDDSLPGSDYFEIEKALAFDIDMSTISSDGKSVKFGGASPLVVGRSYKILLDQKLVGTNEYNILVLEATTSRVVTSDEDLLDVDSEVLLMSDLTMIVDGQEPSFILRNLSTLIDLEISIPATDTREYTLSTLFFGNEKYAIAASYWLYIWPGYDVRNTSEQNYSYYSTSNVAPGYTLYFDPQYKRVLSAAQPLKVRIPLFMLPVSQSNIETLGSSNYVVSFRSTDGDFSVVKKPAKVLKAGVAYRFAAEFTRIDNPSSKYRAALTQFYNSAGGPNWKNSGNWLTSASPSNWYGVISDNYTGEIVEINLNNNNLVGPLFPGLASIASLKRIYLYDNYLSGELPAEILNMPNLRELYINANQFSGTIPPIGDRLASTINTLQLAANKFTGGFPAGLEKCLVMAYFDVAVNELTGAIPEALVRLPNIQKITVNQNKLTGSLPENFTKQANPLTNNLISLRWFHADYNQLSGELPKNLDVQAPDLQVFIVADNNITGNIPSSFGRLPLLGGPNPYSAFDVTQNKMTGRIPAEVLSHENFQYWYWNPQQEGYGLTIFDNSGGGTTDDFIPGELSPSEKMAIEAKLAKPIVQYERESNEVQEGKTQTITTLGLSVGAGSTSGVVVPLLRR